jgi:hypothetical protein
MRLRRNLWLYLVIQTAHKDSMKIQKRGRFQAARQKALSTLGVRESDTSPRSYTSSTFPSEGRTG